MRKAYAPPVRRIKRDLGPSVRYAPGVADLLPPVRSEADYRALHADATAWHPAVRAICERHALPFHEFCQQRGVGSHIVYVRPRHEVIKLYGPIYPSDAGVERAVLGHVHGRVGVTTPEILAEGELESWPYVVMTWIEGRIIADVWPDTAADERNVLGGEIGELLARWHELPTRGLESLDLDWSAFVRAQAASAPDRQRDKGMQDDWLAQIPACLARHVDEAARLPRRVLLNADVCDDHVLVARRSGRWHVVGLIDFGDAFLGRTDYDFVAPTLEILLGDAAAQRAFFSGYGLSGSRLDEELRAELMAWTLLHCFGNLPWILRRSGSTARTLEQLAEHVWPF